MNNFRTISILVFVSIIVACGGGGGESQGPVSPPPPPPPMTYSAPVALRTQPTSDGATVNWELAATGTDKFYFDMVDIKTSQTLGSYEVVPTALQARFVFDPTKRMRFDIWTSSSPSYRLASLAPAQYLAGGVNPTIRLETRNYLWNRIIAAGEQSSYSLSGVTINGNNSGIYTKRVKDTETTHVLAMSELNSNYHFSFPGPLFDSGGNPHIIYFVHDTQISNTGVIRHEWFDGSNWYSESVASKTLDWNDTDLTNGSHTLSAGIDSADRIHLMWENHRDANVQLIEYAVKETDKWTIEIVPNTDIVNGYYPSSFRMVCEENGIPNIVFGYGEDAILLRKLNGIWKQEKIPCGYIASFEQPFELVYSQGKLGLFYDRPFPNNAGDSIWYIERNNGIWGVPENVVPMRTYNNNIPLVFRAAISADGAKLSFMLNQSQNISTMLGFIIYLKTNGAWIQSAPLPELGIDIWTNFTADGHLHFWGRSPNNNFPLSFAGWTIIHGVY